MPEASTSSATSHPSAWSRRRNRCAELERSSAASLPPTPRSASIAHPRLDLRASPRGVDEPHRARRPSSAARGRSSSRWRRTPARSRARRPATARLSNTSRGVIAADQRNRQHADPIVRGVLRSRRANRARDGPAAPCSTGRSTATRRRPSRRAQISVTSPVGARREHVGAAGRHRGKLGVPPAARVRRRTRVRAGERQR